MFRRSLESFRVALDVALKVAVIVGFLAATELVGSRPNLRVVVETVRLIDGQAAADHDGLSADTSRGVASVARRYNERVRHREGTTVEGDDSLIVWLAPLMPEETAVVHNLTPIVYRDQEEGQWALLTESDGKTPLTDNFSDWQSELVGVCGEMLDVINGRYGPAGCQPAAGVLGLHGSTGIPPFAVMLLSADLQDESGDPVPPLESTTELEQALTAIEESFYLEATIVVVNDGRGAAEGVRVVPPPSEPSEEEDENPGKANSGSISNETVPEDVAAARLPTFKLTSGGTCYANRATTLETPFTISAAASCQLTVESNPGDRDGAPLVAHSFQVQAENDSPLFDIRNWGIIGIVLASLLFIVVFLWDFYSRPSSDGLGD